MVERPIYKHMQSLWLAFFFFFFWMYKLHVIAMISFANEQSRSKWEQKMKSFNHLTMQSLPSQPRNKSYNNANRMFSPGQSSGWNGAIPNWQTAKWLISIPAIARLPFKHFRWSQVFSFAEDALVIYRLAFKQKRNRTFDIIK